MTSFPMIDERIRTIGTSKLRNYTAANFRALGDSVLIVQDSADNNLAVLISYESFLAWQAEQKGGTK